MYQNYLSNMTVVRVASATNQIQITVLCDIFLVACSTIGLYCAHLLHISALKVSFFFKGLFVADDIWPCLLCC